jgi:hypothetical protein
MKYVLIVASLLMVTGCNGSDTGTSITSSSTQSPLQAVGPGTDPMTSNPVDTFTISNQLYVLSMGNNLIYQYNVDQNTGEVREFETDRTVQTISKGCNIKIHPNGKWLYVSSCGSVGFSMFNINQSTGALTPFATRDYVTSNSYHIQDFMFDSTGANIVAVIKMGTNYNDMAQPYSMYTFKIDQVTGTLAQDQFLVGETSGGQVNAYIQAHSLQFSNLSQVTAGQTDISINFGNATVDVEKNSVILQKIDVNQARSLVIR